MKLGFDEIKSITFGTVRITEEKGGLAFYKCTENQENVIKSKRPDVLCNATNSTGYRFDFYTNSKFFAVDTASGNKFDLYINDVFVKHIVMTEDRERITAELSGDENRITLYFASHDDVTVITGVELSDGAYFKPHEYKMKMMFCGDSITHGWDSDYDSLSYAWRVANFFDAECVNQSVGGACFYADFAEKIDFDPDVIVIAYGTNDFSHCDTLDEVYNNAVNYLKKMKELYKNSKFFVLSPIWRADEISNVKPMGTFAQCCETVKRAIKKFDVTFVDGYTLTPHIPDFYSDKYLHPNAMGFGIYAENLIKIMLKDISVK